MQRIRRNNDMKRKMMKMAAMMMAMTMVMGSAMTVHASDDGCVRDDGIGYGDAGVSYVTINDAVIIDIEAEAAQQQK